MTALAVLHCLLVSCDSHRPDRVVVLDYGTYDAVIILKGSRLLGEDPEILTIDGVQHRRETTTVEAEDGSYFGFRLDPVTLPSDYKLKLEYEHPAFVLPDGTSSTIDVSELHVTDPREFDGVVLWYFLDGFDYEMVPGEWTFRVSIDSTVVAEQKFTVVRTK